MENIIHNFVVIVPNISIHDSVKTLFISQYFQQKSVNNIHVLTFIQIHTVLTDKKYDY